MPEPKRPHLPIGYWLKRLDQVLNARIDEAQAAHGLTRREWQVLNSVHETGTASRAGIAQWLKPFAGKTAVNETIDHLVKRGLIEATTAGGADLRLTHEGRRVHAAALETQRQVRVRAVDGISEFDYATTLAVLQRMVRNLEPDQEGDSPAS